MKNFKSAFAKLEKEQNSYAENIQNSIGLLLQASGMRHVFCQIHSIAPNLPQLGKEFIFSVDGHPFTYEVRIQNDFISVSGGSLKKSRVHMSKKWLSLNKFKKEFIQALKPCLI